MGLGFQASFFPRPGLAGVLSHARLLQPRPPLRVAAPPRAQACLSSWPQSPRPTSPRCSPRRLRVQPRATPPPLPPPRARGGSDAAQEWMAKPPPWPVVGRRRPRRRGTSRQVEPHARATLGTAVDFWRSRDNAHISQAVFARYLNLTTGYVSQLERGAPLPVDAVLALLTVVRRKEIEGIL